LWNNIDRIAVISGMTGGSVKAAARLSGDDNDSDFPAAISTGLILVLIRNHQCRRRRRRRRRRMVYFSNA
jgi:hypothetical protein